MTITRQSGLVTFLFYIHHKNQGSETYRNEQTDRQTDRQTDQVTGRNPSCRCDTADQAVVLLYK